MKKTVFTLVAMLSAFSAPLYAESRAEILRILQQTPHAACEIEPQGVRIIRTYRSIYVLYGTEGLYDPAYKEYSSEGIPCSFGNATYVPYLSKLENINGQLRITDLNLFRKLDIHAGSIDKDNMKVSNGIWTFTNREYAKDDGRCCPSEVYFNQIRLSDMKVLSRKLIGRKRYY
ncbi:hypothetical protein [Neisseria weaveri]|uniref:hypothetical protein n=1 Tax=Neisseria weaveri TaxID=28091 RepID=UPI001145A38E|nr:hypothetical protein [Neisseria weaveri]